jgi:3-hydroxy-9,10-secoandrosta-1,3,5(10)-triene-9,17-dione monooxygenase
MGQRCDERHWIFAMMLLDSNGNNGPALALIPAKEVEVLDTWHVDGLKGSGSNTVVIKDVFIPTRHLVSEEGLLAGNTSGSRLLLEPIFHTPMVSRAGFFAAVSVVGAAQGALEQVKRAWSNLASAKPTHEFATRYARLGEAHLMINAAECLVRETGRQMLIVPHTKEKQIWLRIETRSRFAYAVKLCRDAVHLLNAGAGSSVHRLSAPFQRFLGDINMMTSNVGFDEDQSFELAGRSLLGLPANTTIF